MTNAKLKQLRSARESHYLLEVELAERLRNSFAAERASVYSAVYDELFRRVPNHPQLEVDPEERERKVLERLKFVRRFGGADACLLEIGCGDCAFVLAAARSLPRVVGVDVSEEIISRGAAHDNIEVYVTDGIHLPLDSESVDVVFSDQLMEHLHPDDAVAQLHEIRRVLRPGGIYVCITPNRASGPHDVSGLFDDVARGFHLREYTSQDLATVFSASGFTRLDFYVGGKGHYFRVPDAAQRMFEVGFAALPHSWRVRFRSSLLTYALLGLNVVAS